ncbi:MAG: T9SS type A sorting domain-containing protein [Ignavibacteria bacterium]|nr:T9SS type A sorting domain-containing protein [Ignavibacteria bacterium]
MKRITATLASLFLLFIIFSSPLQSQWIYNLNCGMEEEWPTTSSQFGTGMFKPMKTLPANDTSAYIRVLLVYVEFKNDDAWSETYWPYQEPPVYSDDLFAPVKSTGINAYSDYYISNYFNKISNDQFDMIGDVKHIILDKEYDDYIGGGCYQNAMLDVLRTLDTSSNLNYRADWRRYDLWKWNGVAEEFQNSQDSIVDMIYVQFRRSDFCGMISGGFASLGVDYSTLNFNKEIKGCALCFEGSGLMGINGWEMPVGAAIGYFRHEYSHYTLGDHRPYSTIGGQDGQRTIMGYELGYSPQDLITVGLADVTIFNAGITETYTLNDMQTTGEILKVPTGTSGEYFLVSNRRRIAGTGPYTWDCNMGGDTAMGLPYLQFGDYSKGLYIYHVSGGDDFQAWADLECADGLWNWEHLGTSTPDWHATQTLAVLGKTGVGYNEDNPTTAYYGEGSRLTSRDGLSVVSQTSNPYPAWGQKWFGIGKRHTCINELSCRKGTDRNFTNLEENWTAREHQGDRWDAWALEYNVMFSPYSSPNTKDRSGNQTGIFIYYSGLSSNVATVKIYQAAANTEDEDDILEATPPSKPMLFRAIELYNCNGTFAYPRITWDNNLEPDMIRGDDVTFKRYKVYRASSSYSSVAPYNYTYIGVYDDYTPNDTANYIDNDPYNGVTVQCSEEGGGSDDTYFRYKIVAVDKYDDESVKSDFVAIKGSWISEPDNMGIPGNNPREFSLKQNYPNPFNPSTQISFSIPQNTFITLRVYNAVGQLVVTLVNNEYRIAGQYDVDFDGTGLASGIYFYTIDAGIYKDVKKMVLLK